MLNWTTVLEYVKDTLSLPSSFIEKSDTDLKKRITNITIPLFSKYYPDNEYTSVISDNDNYKHSTRSGYFYFFDDEDLDIYGIIDCYFNQTDDLFIGHPSIGAFNFEGFSWWSLDVFKSRFFKPFSNFNYSYHFRPPNIVHVIPNATTQSSSIGNFVVKYEREQPHDLRNIPAGFKTMFLDLALAEIKIWLGSIRSNYGDGILTTPFGDIPLRGDVLLDEGKTDKQELISFMEEDSLPSIIMSTDGSY